MAPAVFTVAFVACQTSIAHQQGWRKHSKVGTETIGPKAVDGGGGGGEYREYICQRSSHVHIILHGKIARSSQAPLHVWILLCKDSYHEKMYAMPINTGTQDIVRPHTCLKVYRWTNQCSDGQMWPLRPSEARSVISAARQLYYCDGQIWPEALFPPPPPDYSRVSYLDQKRPFLWLSSVQCSTYPVLHILILSAAMKCCSSLVFWVPL